MWSWEQIDANSLTAKYQLLLKMGRSAVGRSIKKPSLELLTTWLMKP